MKFCTKCGNPIEPGVKFCTKCGASIGVDAQPSTLRVPAQPVAPVVAQQPGAAAPWQSTPVVPAQPPVATTKSGCMPAVLVGLGVIVLIAVLGIGGLVYAGFKLKQKASSIAAKLNSPPSAPSRNTDNSGEQKSNGQNSDEQILNGLANLLQSKQEMDKGDVVPTISKRDPVVPCSPGPMPSQDGARIPLRKGTVVTRAWGIKKGDVELRIKVVSVDNTGVTDTTSSDEYIDDNEDRISAVQDANTFCSEDLREATVYATETSRSFPEILHGLTRLRLSAKTFGEIHTVGHTHLAYGGFWPIDEERFAPMFEDGDLVWMEKEDVPYPLIVNDQRVTVPAIHLSGIFDVHGKDPRPKHYRPAHVSTELYVLDDPLDPLVLLLKMTDPKYHDGKFRVEVTKITFEVPHPINLVEKQLAEQKRAITYGIYFDFNKDTIKPESDPVLKQIVQALTDHPDWKLTVNGHTDNIGGDAYNLDLSKRRAAAVKQILVSRFHIAPDRLSTNGCGESGPIDTNDTLEGRARNRRVELTRE